jgi:hypothetical protein
MDGAVRVDKHGMPRCGEAEETNPHEGAAKMGRGSAELASQLAREAIAGGQRPQRTGLDLIAEDEPRRQLPDEVEARRAEIELSGVKDPAPVRDEEAEVGEHKGEQRAVFGCPRAQEPFRAYVAPDGREDDFGRRLAVAVVEKAADDAVYGGSEVSGRLAVVWDDFLSGWMVRAIQSRCWLRTRWAASKKPHRPDSLTGASCRNRSG